MKNTCPRCASLCVKFKLVNQFGENDQNHPRFLCLQCKFREQASVSTGALGQSSASNLLQESASRDNQTYTRHATEETAQPFIASIEERCSPVCNEESAQLQAQESCLVPAPMSTSLSPSEVREQSIPISPETMRRAPGTEGTLTVWVVNKCPRCSSIHTGGINTRHRISTVHKPRYECQMCGSFFDLIRMFYQTGLAVFPEAVGDHATFEEPIDLVRVIKTCPICSSTSTRFKSLIVYSTKSSSQLCLKCSSESRLQLQVASEKLF